MNSVTLCLVNVGVLAVSQLAYGQDYQPLDVGWRWEYSGNDGGTLVREVVGTATIIGREAAVIMNTATGGSVISGWTYESKSNEGDVRVHGTSSQDGSITDYFDPPSTMISLPLTLGRTWDVTTQVYCDPEGTIPLGDPNTQTIEVLEIGTVSVPAGVFEGVKVSAAVCPVCETPGANAAGGLHVRSKRDKKGVTASAWWVDGLGMVQFEVLGTVYSLTSWEAGPVDVRGATWGKTKARYR